MVKKLKLGKCGQTAGLIGTNFGALMQIHLERVVGPKKIAGGIGVRGWGVRNSKVRKSTCEHTHAYSSTKGSRPIGGWGSVGGGGGRGSEIQKSEKAHVNTHTHMHIHLQRVVGQIQISPV